MWNAHTKFFDEEGNEATTLKKLFNGKSDCEGEFTLIKPGIYDLTEIGLLEVEEIGYKVRIYRDESTMEINLNETEKAIMEDVLENTSCYLNDDGSVTKFQML